MLTTIMAISIFKRCCDCLHANTNASVEHCVIVLLFKFHELAHNCSRPTAARIFEHVVALASQNIIIAQQRTVFGIIGLYRGRRF